MAGIDGVCPALAVQSEYLGRTAYDEFMVQCAVWTHADAASYYCRECSRRACWRAYWHQHGTHHRRRGMGLRPQAWLLLSGLVAQ